MVDFDDIDDWAPRLALALSQHVPNSVGPTLAAEGPQYVEDARARLFDLTSRVAVISATLAWIRSTSIAGYHGSRLLEADVASIRSIGLIPLEAEARRHRLVRALSSHGDWPNVVSRLDATISSNGQARAVGHREGQVHLTLSRAGLTNGFNHYLTHGAEFDQHVAFMLLGQDGCDLLAHDGTPTVIQFAVPGIRALDATHPHFSVDDMQARGEIPNLANEFLSAWSYRLAHPEFQSRTLKVDCGMRFNSIVPADWIVAIDTQVD